MRVLCLFYQSPAARAKELPRPPARAESPTHERYPQVLLRTGLHRWAEGVQHMCWRILWWTLIISPREHHSNPRWSVAYNSISIDQESFICVNIYEVNFSLLFSIFQMLKLKAVSISLFNSLFSITPQTQNTPLLFYNTFSGLLK